MSNTVGDFFWERLHQWGVRIVFGYPGDGINGLLGAMNRADGTIRFDPGAPRGDGRVHGLGLRQVHRRTRRLHGDLRPRRVRTSSPASTTRAWTTCRCWRSPASRRARRIGGHYQQELDLQSMFKDVAGAFVAAGDRAGPGAPPGRPRRPHRQGRAPRHRHHPAERPAGRRRMRSRRASTAPSIPASATATRVSSRTTPICGAPPTCSTRARRSRSWSAPARCTRPTR